METAWAASSRALLRETAADLDIDVQWEIATGRTGTDGDTVNPRPVVSSPTVVAAQMPMEAPLAAASLARFWCASRRRWRRASISVR